MSASVDSNYKNIFEKFRQSAIWVTHQSGSISNLGQSPTWVTTSYTKKTELILRFRKSIHEQLSYKLIHN
jgi:hypothetical protein